MAEITQSLDDALAEQGIVGSYIWKPFRLYYRNSNAAEGEELYPSVDVIADGEVNDVKAAISDAGVNQIADITAKGEEQLAILNRMERNFSNYKSNLIQAFTRMHNYYLMHHMEDIATVTNNAIRNLSNI